VLGQERVPAHPADEEGLRAAGLTEDALATVRAEQGVRRPRRVPDVEALALELAPQQPLDAALGRPVSETLTRLLLHERGHDAGDALSFGQADKRHHIRSEVVLQLDRPATALVRGDRERLRPAPGSPHLSERHARA
jgi:hypothetical protein